MKKTRIVIIFIIAGILTGLTIINAKTSISQTREEKTTQEVNYTTETQTTLTTSKNVFTTTTKKATKKTTKKITMKVNTNQQEILDYLHQEILNMGWSTKDYESAVNLMIKESGINPNSVNKSSGACGLFQAYPCKKVIKQYPDYMTNYKSQVKWGLNYIKGRYGTPINAWQFWQEHKWY